MSFQDSPLISKIRVVTQRHAVVQRLYLASFCLIYLMPNIWAARTLFYYFVLPLALINLSLPLARSIVSRPVFILSGAFLLLLTLTSLAAPDVSFKVVGYHLLNTVRVLLFVLITAELIEKDDAFLKTLVLCMAAAAAVAAVVNIVAYYGPYSGGLRSFAVRLEGIPGISPYYNSNVVGAIFAIPCVAAFGLIGAHGLSRGQNGAIMLLVLILLVAVVLTQSRGATLGVIAGLAVKALANGTRQQRIALAASAAGALVLIYFATPQLASMLDRGAGLRPGLWRHFLQMAWDNPWLGVGLTFDVSIDNILTAHNIILSALVRGGVLAAALLVGILLFCFQRSFEAWRRGGLIMPFALMTAVTVMTMVDHEIIATSLGWEWLLFWLPVAMCLAVDHRQVWHGLASVQPSPANAASAKNS